MKRRIVVAALAAAALVLAGVAVAQPGRPTALRKGTIEVFVRDGTCHTRTTPFFSVSIKGDRVALWEIRDETNGCTAANDVEIRFDKKSADPVPMCTKRGKQRIQCDLSGAKPGRYDYSVRLGAQQEDPELDIGI